MKIQNINSYNFYRAQSKNSSADNKTVDLSDNKRSAPASKILKADFSNLKKVNSELLKIYFLGSNKDTTKREEIERFYKYFDPVEDYEYFEEFKKFCFEKGKLKRKDFENISKDKRLDFTMLSYDFINNCCEQDIMQPDTIANYSNDLKKYFDNKYGKNKYRIISLGTSPSTIAQGMEYLGCEVIYLPFSDLKKTSDTKITSIKDVKSSYKDCNNTKILMRYLTSKGIGENNDRKTNIIIDYVSSGTNIYSVAKFMNEYLSKRNPKHSPKIKVCNLLETLQAIENKKIFKGNKVTRQKDLDTLTYLCLDSVIEDVSVTPHFSVSGKKSSFENYINFENKTEKELFEEFEEFSTPLSKMYSICLLNEIKEIENEKK